MRKAFFKIKDKIVIPWKWFEKLSIKRKIITIAFLFITLIIASQILSALTRPAPYTLEKVTKSNITETVTESGNIVASGRIDVYSPTNGVVTEMYAENGSYVDEGDALFKVKSSATDQEAQAAYSNYLAAQATLNAAQTMANTLRAGMYTEWKTFRDLATNSTYEKGDDTPNMENRLAAEFQIAQDEWLAAEKKYKDQQTAIAQAQALTSSTWSLYQATQDSTVTSPVSGTITNLSVTKGSTVAIKTISLTGSPTTPALIITSDYKNEISLALSETDVTKVRPGQQAVVKVNAVADKKYQGIVDRVDSVGTNNQGVVTYNTYISLLNGNDMVRQGMTVDVDITTKEIKNVLSVSNSAVKPYKGGRAVRIPDAKAKEKFKYLPVVTGVKGSGRTQIIKGIMEGQEVISTLSNEKIKRPGLFGS